MLHARVCCGAGRRRRRARRVGRPLTPNDPYNDLISEDCIVVAACRAGGGGGGVGYGDSGAAGDGGRDGAVRGGALRCVQRGAGHPHS